MIGKTARIFLNIKRNTRLPYCASDPAPVGEHEMLWKLSKQGFPVHQPIVISRTKRIRFL